MRPLSGFDAVGSIPLGSSNVGLLHEHGFFDDGSNVGFFPEGIRPDDDNFLDQYEMTGPFYDDAIMGEALQNLHESGNWQELCSFLVYRLNKKAVPLML